MVSMSEAMADQPVTFLSLLLEAPNDQDAIAWSQAFLHKQKAPFKHYRMDENLMQAMAKLDLIAIPVVEILSVDGETARKLTNDDPNQQFTEDDVRNTVLALLAELEERESTN